ncbi:MAG: hypothetical protein UR28_C0012G0021 [Candidatus Peregrinibacteria bacterium GW2011_GWF2_33_10]|nr:MAG: hypothetical protein UR28_C0012G0021 [Candidatus Peregrinibacteria bacterium GW2011_GWF2_33_10]OGJ44073.1 MAG: hypothetical protein A2263_01570 [Candidatus Peregrinibacteria bacterium RIFOXYA2_FULL_33_21]OGJ45719.1 MAG: hypothetical protein A2272_03865 [Candidatus Peregrinibacteria bacterium RIFOXYA12_FULL_33_12]OGJ51402.1 MAG: hypothetical protein A2307_02535 [Candidatus Peregrinibacteria bacterium RIFOXYB2_FULL_33_20]
MNYEALTKGNRLFFKGNRVFIKNGDVNRALELYEKGLEEFRNAGLSESFIKEHERSVKHIRSLIDRAVLDGANPDEIKITSSLLIDKRPVENEDTRKQIGTTAELINVVETGRSYILARSRIDGSDEIIEGGLPNNGFEKN